MLLNKTTSVYAISFVIFAVGIWLILQYGSTLLRAREDLAGEWELTPISATDSSPASSPVKMQVEQSGQYLNIALPNSPAMNLLMTTEEITDEHFGQHKRIVLTGNGQTFEFDGTAGGSNWTITRSGATSAKWQGRLAERMYPRAVPTTKPSTQPQAKLNAR